MPTIEADYLVVGAGAMGMAFADTIATESDASLVIVDRYHQPGGHWNTAYPYVRLHQPSAFYGVNSRKLGSDTIDRVGWNEGLFELATAGEVCAYFDQVMQQQLFRPAAFYISRSANTSVMDRFARLRSGLHRKSSPARRRLDLHARCRPVDAAAGLCGRTGDHLRSAQRSAEVPRGT